METGALRNNPQLVNIQIGRLFSPFCMARSVRKFFVEISTHLLIMEVDFCPVLCIPEVPVLQAFRGISHFVWYCKAVPDLS